MRAAVYRERGRLEVAEVPDPELGDEDVLIEVSHCGICGTDLHMVLDGWGRPGSIGGHEYSGIVRATGPKARPWTVGQAVVATPQIEGCGRCRPCRDGRPSLCSGRPRPGLDPFQGAFAEYVRVDRRQVVAVPPGLPLRTAALTEPLAVALHAVTLSAKDGPRRALVSGGGPIGALIAGALLARGVPEVVVSEPAERRRELARRLGAIAIDPAALEVPPLPFDCVENPFDVAFECSGRATAAEACLAQLDRGGRLVLVGTGTERPRLDANRVLLNELTITGAFNYDAGGFERALDLLASGALHAETFLEPEDVGLEGILGAMERLASGEAAGKILVTPRR